MIQCPGCGGRNPETAVVCDWCARPFRNHEPRFRLNRTVVLLAAGVAMLGVALGVVTLLASSRTTPGASPPAATIVSAPVASPAVVAASPKPVVEATVAVVRPAPPAQRQARIANTGGQGALIRREPSVNAPNVALIPEDGIVRILGPEETVQAQVWRQVEDSQGVQGWVRADFLVLLESDVPTAPSP